MKKNKITQKDILFFSISMFVIVVAWVGFTLFHTWATSTISEDLKIQIIPIKSEFDTATIESLKKREQANPIFEKTGARAASPEANLSPTPIEIEVPPILEEPVPTEEATPTEEAAPTL